MTTIQPVVVLIYHRQVSSEDASRMLQTITEQNNCTPLFTIDLCATYLFMFWGVNTNLHFLYHAFFPDYSVLVLGAGIAGMRAAQLLSEAGASVRIIEGSDRIGGMLWTHMQKSMKLKHQYQAFPVHHSQP